jgi:hypothetical protein
MASTPEESELGFDVGYDGHQRRQACLGLALTPTQRLVWLERKLAEMRGLLGKVQKEHPKTEPTESECDEPARISNVELTKKVRP